MESSKELTEKIIIIGLAVSLITGILDVTIGLVSSYSFFMVFRSVLLPLTITTIITFLIFTISWTLIGKNISRRFSLEPVALAISLGIFISIAIILCSLNYLSIVEADTYLLLIKILIIFLLASIVSIISYFAVCNIYKFDSRSLIGNSVGVLLPMFLLELLIFIWLNAFGKLSLYSSSLGFVIFAILTSLIYFRTFRTIKTKKVLSIIFLIVLFCGPLVFAYNHFSDSSENGRNLSSDHEIKNIILISIDTLRTDVLSSYGSKKVATPNIDQIAQDGYLFTNAYSPSPWTLPSVAAIMTGLSPQVYMFKDIEFRLPDVLTTLAEHMLNSGYKTAAIGENLFLHPEFNLDQGFMEYNFFPKRKKLVDSFGGAIIYTVFPNHFRDETNTTHLTDLTTKWLDDNYKNDFFLWIHYYDPHLPYYPPKEYLVNPDDSLTFYDPEIAERIRAGVFKPTIEQKKEMKRLYNAEVAYVDDNIGKILEKLEELDLYDDSLIIITSDHGEEFWEHGRFEHGHSLYNELINVPLIIKLPNKSDSMTIETEVSTISIMPTILELSGVNYNDRYISKSLAPLLDSNMDKFESGPIISSFLRVYEDREAAIFNGKKYIRTIETNNEEFYDLESDPGEQHPISISLIPDKINYAKQILEEYKNQSQISTKHYGSEYGETVVIDKDKREKLKSLGYMQ